MNTYPKNNIIVDGMEDEGGITDISLTNAKLIMEELGRPSEITLSYDEEDWYCVTGTWLINGCDYHHTFTGFAWGYGGTGCQGLKKFFDGCGIKRFGMKEIASMDEKNPQPSVFIPTLID